MRVSERMKKQARQADLFQFLLDNHPTTVESCGPKALQNIDHKSLKIVKGHGYNHFSRGKGGNAIDYLIEYLGYDFVGAVLALLPYSNGMDGYEHTGYNPEEKQYDPFRYKSPPKKNGTIVLPEKTTQKYSRLFAYLIKSRGISSNIVENAVRQHLIYQDDRGNMVFKSGNCDYAEIKGTGSASYKKIAENSDSDGYWAFRPMPDREIVTAYVCESAIDALSLYQLIKDDRAVYCSMGGLKKSALAHIVHDYNNVVIAVDNDDAGDNFYSENIGNRLNRIKPKSKDWNEDLQSKSSSKTES